MKNYLRSNKGITIKELIIIFVALVIVFGVGFYISMLYSEGEIKTYEDKIKNLEEQISTKQEEKEIVKQDQENQNKNEVDESKTIANKQESNILEEFVKTIYNRAISAKIEFRYGEFNNNAEAEIKNYDEIMYAIFTENGRKIFEKENKGLVNIKGEKAYMVAGDDSTGEYILNTSFEDIVQEGDTITANVVRKMSKEEIVDLDRNNLKDSDTYTLKDKLVIKKEDNNWLVDEYSWVIPTSQQS